MTLCLYLFFFFFSSRRRHTRLTCDWSSDVCSSDLSSPTSCPRTRSGSTTWWRPPAGGTRNWPAPARAPSGPATRIRTRSQPKTTGMTRTTRTPDPVPGKQRDPGRPDPWESGLVIVDKPGGMTSHDVVARIRRLAHTRRVGHAGTLDPMATGVLVIGIEKATRLLGHLMLTEKTYEATVRLGQSTSTDDAEGEPTGTAL